MSDTVTTNPDTAISNDNKEFFDVIEWYEDDEDNRKDNLDDADSLTSREMILKSKFRFFLYSHPHDTEDNIHSAAGVYLRRNNDMTLVFTMAIGIAEFSGITEKEPFTLTNKKPHTKVFNPTREMLQQEIVRRGHFIGNRKYAKVEQNPLAKSGKIEFPRPKAWLVEKCLDWLKNPKHALTYKEVDYIFLRTQIELYTEFLRRDLSRKNNKPDETSWDRSGWEGIVPNIRLIEIILSDDLRIDFLHRNAGISRTENDAHNTESKKLDFFEKVQRKFNDPSVKIKSCVLDESWGRQIFLESHDCNWDQLISLKIDEIPDAKACKTHFNKLNNILGGIYQKWKNSGNGEDQLACNLEEGTAPVDLEKLPTQAADRIDFLHNANICVMYLWFMLLKTGTFQDAQTELPSDHAADDGNAPDFDNSSLETGGGRSVKSTARKGAKGNTMEGLFVVEKITGEIGKLKDFFLVKENERDRKEKLRDYKEDLDRLINERNTIRADTHQLKSDLHDLETEKLKLELDLSGETIGGRINLIQRRVNDLSAKIAEIEDSIKAKNQELEKIMAKIKQQEIVVQKFRSGQTLHQLEDKTPRRSGDSTRSRPPTTVLIRGDEDRLSHLNFTPGDLETPYLPKKTAAETETPTATESQIEELLKKRRAAEETAAETAAETETPTATESQMEDFLRKRKRVDDDDKNEEDEDEEEYEESPDLLASNNTY